MSTLTATSPAPSASTSAAAEPWDNRNAVELPDGTKVNDLNSEHAVINSRLNRAAEQGLFQNRDSVIAQGQQEYSTELRLGNDERVTHISKENAGGNFSGSEIKNVVFSQTNVRGGVYYGSAFDNVKYGRGCDGEGASFINCDFRNGCDLSGLQRVRSLRDSTVSTDSKIGALNMNGGDLSGLRFFRPETGETLNAGQYFNQLVQEGGEKYALKEFKKMFNGMRYNASTLMDQDLRLILDKVSRSVANLDESSLTTKESLFSELMANPHFANKGELQSADIISKDGKKDNALVIRLKDKEPGNSVEITVEADETKKGERFRVSYAINGDLLTSMYLEKRGIPPETTATVTGPEAFSQVLSAVRDFERQFKQAELKGSRQVKDAPEFFEPARHSDSQNAIATILRSDIAGFNAKVEENKQIRAEVVDSAADRIGRLVNGRTGDFDDQRAAALDRYLRRYDSLPSKDDSKTRFPLSEEQRAFLREEIRQVREVFNPYSPATNAEIDYDKWADKISGVLEAYHRARIIGTDGEEFLNTKAQEVVSAAPEKKQETISAVVEELKELRAKGDVGLRSLGLSDGATAVVIDRLVDLSYLVLAREKAAEAAATREVQPPDDEPAAATSETSAESTEEAPPGSETAAESTAAPESEELREEAEREEVIAIDDSPSPKSGSAEAEVDKQAAEDLAAAIVDNLKERKAANEKLYSSYTEDIRRRSERAAVVLDVVREGGINFATGIVVDEVNVRATIETERQGIMKKKADATNGSGAEGQVADISALDADMAALDEIEQKLFGSPNMFGVSKD